MKVPAQISSLRFDPKIFYHALEERRGHNQPIDSSQAMSDQQNEEDEIVDLISANFDRKTLIKDFRTFESKLPFYMNCTQNVLVTHGIELENLKTQPKVSKSYDHLAQLDSYEFVANYETNVTEECDKIRLFEYVQVTL